MALRVRDPPAWKAPDRAASGNSSHLSLYNSLTHSKSQFIPIDPTGRRVTWYCCGPTVYDAGHLGHARNYLTTDVLRRIMKDYFGYEVVFVQNVTDVDDKIINRAREGHFLQQYKGDHPQISEQVITDTEAAFNMYCALTPEVPLHISSDEFLSWIPTQRSFLETPVLDEQQTLLKMRLLTLDTAAVALQQARAGAIAESDRYYASVAPILSLYLDHTLKGGLSKNDHSIFSDFAARWEAHFNEDLRVLNCLLPTYTTRVSEFIAENIAFVQRIIDNGFAYAIPGGTVYFDVQAFEDSGHFYAKLEPGNRLNEAKAEESANEFVSDDLKTAEQLEIEQEIKMKRGPRDFAVWKKSRVGEPGWQAPWGYGRPGWHIECSAMASQVLGSHIDIHSGGIDLAFPHHDNELAQSEAYWFQDPKREEGPVQWVNYFIHMGHLSIAGSKMSKSLKNFVTIREALANGDWTPRRLRLLFMRGSWRGGIEISPTLRQEVDVWERTANNFFSNVRALIMEEEASNVSSARTPHLFRSQERELLNSLDKAQKEMHGALCDSFNTTLTLDILLGVITNTNSYMKSNQKTPSSPDAYFSLDAVTEAARWVTRMLLIFGFPGQPDSIGWLVEQSSNIDSAQSKESIALPYIRVLSQFRDRVRQRALADASSDMSQDLLHLSDSLRDHDLIPLGVSLEDRNSAIGEPALVKMGPAAELIAARDAKVRQAQEAELQRDSARAEKIRAEQEKREQANVDPKEMFRMDEYSEWDADGIPTKDAVGQDVAKSKRKTLKKSWDKQKKLHDTYNSSALK
ncbi:cysteinyl-tRNA synthetase [Mycena epipterygia]|nr:cysteinyl-tRNA synthetase [Mycena epipterygia]